MEPVHQKTISFIKANKLFEGSNRVLIALSGGADSVYLLDFLYKFKRLFRIELGAFHLNHSLRGAEAARDSTFCALICRNYGIPFYYKKRNVAAYAKKNGFSVEEAARIIRYDELTKIARDENFDLIATGHIIEDNSETMLLNFVKGAGLNGLAGIPPRRGNIVRPLLALSKNEITSYLGKNGIEYKVDSTNEISDYDRNFLRINILPQLRARLNPSLDLALLRTAGTLAGYRNFIEENIVIPYAESFLLKKTKEILMPVNTLLGLNEIIRGRILQEAIQRKFNVSLSNERISECLSLMDKQPGRSVEFEGGLTALRERGSIKIGYQTNALRIKKELPEKVWVEAGSKRIFVERIENGNPEFSSNRNEEILGFTALPDKFIVRNWQKGDSFIPLGMKGEKKVSDFLTDEKIMTGNKGEQLVVTVGDRIVWVVGLRIDDRFKLTNKSKYIFRLKAENNG